MTPFLKKIIPQSWFASWKEWLGAVFLEISLLSISFFAAFAFHKTFHLGLFADFVIFLVTLMTITIIVIRIFLKLYPPIDGSFTRQEHPQIVFSWAVISFLCMTNLFLYYQCSLLPTPIRKFISRLLGGKVGKGIISIAGLVIDPYCITIEEGVVIGHESLIVPHSFIAERLIRRRITIKSGAVIGARSVIMPGATIGEKAMIKAMSVVSEGTNIPAYEIWGGIPARKMGELPRPAGNEPAADTFASWRDMIISPSVEVVLLSASGYAAWQVAHYFKFGLFGGVLLFYGSLVALTLLTLFLLRTIWPFREGRYSFKDHPWVCYRWNLHGFLCIMNLFLHYQNGVLSPILRRSFNRLLGAKINGKRGFLPLCATVMDPYMTEINEGSIMCNDALVLGHALTTNELILAPVKIKEHAVLDLRAMVMPNVTLEAGAHVGPLSLITTGTTVKSNEIYLGMPARKIGETEPAEDNMELSFKMNTGQITYIACVRILLILCAATGTLALLPLWWGDGFAFWLTFHVLDVVIVLMALMLFRRIFDFKPGVYTSQQHPRLILHWGLYDSILVSHLNWYYSNALLPPHLRTIFLRILGLKANHDLFLTGGLINDPHLVSIGKNVLVGCEAMVSPIQVTKNFLTMGHITIGDRVWIGHRAVILPNVTIGNGSIVETMSLVMPGTNIPAYEIWGGIPAKKIGEVGRT